MLSGYAPISEQIATAKPFGWLSHSVKPLNRASFFINRSLREKRKGKTDDDRKYCIINTLWCILYPTICMSQTQSTLKEV